MKTHNLVQGTPAWHQHRATHFNASDAPAMLGISQYKSRNQLLKEMATGIGQEFDAATERRFADGHRFEALARPLAEHIIGADLYPVTASEGKLSASFDGITLDETACFEHKSLNATLRSVEFSDGGRELPEEYRAQMEQQLMISGANECLFMASKWNEDDTLIEELHCRYLSDQTMRDRIVHGWVQFSIDLESYQHIEPVEKPQADEVMALPSLAVQIKGEVTASNLPVFVSAADKFLAGIKTELTTDQDFANAEANVKACKAAEDGIEQTKKAITAQATSIDEVMRTMDLYKEKLANVRLKLDKLVKSEKDARKLAIISKASLAFSAHVQQLETEISPIKLLVFKPDFAGAMKGLKKLSAMQEAVDTALRDEIFAADQVAKDVRAKLAWCKEHAAGHSALFPDLQQIITKPMDDFTLLITSRIDKHKADEAARLEAERAKMQAEATAKAEREAAAKLATEEARIRAEEREKAEAGQRAATEVQAKIDAAAKPSPELVKEIAESVVKTGSAAVKGGVVVDIRKPVRPGDKELIEFIADSYGVGFDTAFTWMAETTERMMAA